MSCESPSFFSGAEVSAVSASWVSSELNSSPTVGTGSDALLVSSAASSIGASAPMVVGGASAGVLGRYRFGGDLDRQGRVRHRLPDRTGRWRHLLGRRRHGLDVALGLCALGLVTLGLCALDRLALHLVADAVACALPARVPAPGRPAGPGRVGRSRTGGRRSAGGSRRAPRLVASGEGHRQDAGQGPRAPRRSGRRMVPTQILTRLSRAAPGRAGAGDVALTVTAEGRGCSGASMTYVVALVICRFLCRGGPGGPAVGNRGRPAAGPGWPGLR